MPSSPINHLIVVLLENRSYDNVLGWLYNSANPPPYNLAPPGQSIPGQPGVSALNGLTGNETNPCPGSTSGQTIKVSNASATTIPAIDPGEPFNEMAQQIYGFADVPTKNPYTSAPPTGAGAMQGFTLNYAALKDFFGHAKVPPADYPNCMTYFTPAQVPVTAWLANHFAVCDQWFGSVPTQTYTNRNFAVCASPAIAPETLGANSYSLVDDAQYIYANAREGLEDQPSIFSLLDSASCAGPAGVPNWKLYFHDFSVAATIVPYVRNAGLSTNNINIATFDNTDWGGNTPRFNVIPQSLIKIGESLGSVTTTFMEDLAAGNLPPLSFIEPRYSYDFADNHLPANSNHPGLSGLTGTRGAPFDVADGEAFLAQLYNALRNSSIWESCLLIVTYDEHGGMYDHVPPPPAPVAPAGQAFPVVSDPHHHLNSGDPAAYGFSFNYLGPPVPTLIVSPFISAGSMIPPPSSTPGNAPPFDHSAIVGAVRDCLLNGAGALTYWDAASPSLLPWLNGSNTTGQCPFPAQASIVALDSSKQPWSIDVNDSGVISTTKTSPPSSLRTIVLQDTAVPSDFCQLGVTTEGDPAVTSIVGPPTYAASLGMRSPDGALWIVQVTKGALVVGSATI
jgi:phospholipase C